MSKRKSILFYYKKLNQIIRFPEVFFAVVVVVVVVIIIYYYSLVFLFDIID